MASGRAEAACGTVVVRKAQLQLSWELWSKKKKKVRERSREESKREENLFKKNKALQNLPHGKFGVLLGLIKKKKPINYFS